MSSLARYGSLVAAVTDTDGVYLIDLEDPTRPATHDHWGGFGF